MTIKSSDIMESQFAFFNSKSPMWHITGSTPILEEGV